ncbi:uncharacterized protein LOC135367007 [Ornithodoros turicata]|uniref:uncharacterized protein LOC135367007 n=1 Tax=Ornithodoros turicata TaxID=34597 RepID=UPI00313A45FF
MQTQPSSSNVGGRGRTSLPHFRRLSLRAISKPHVSGSSVATESNLNAPRATSSLLGQKASDNSSCVINVNSNPHTRNSRSSHGTLGVPGSIAVTGRSPSVSKVASKDHHPPQKLRSSTRSLGSVSGTPLVLRVSSPKFQTASHDRDLRDTSSGSSQPCVHIWPISSKLCCEIPELKGPAATGRSDTGNETRRLRWSLSEDRHNGEVSEIWIDSDTLHGETERRIRPTSGILKTSKTSSFTDQLSALNHALPSPLSGSSAQADNRPATDVADATDATDTNCRLDREPLKSSFFRSWSDTEQQVHEQTERDRSHQTLINDTVSLFSKPMFTDMLLPTKITPTFFQLSSTIPPVPAALTSTSARAPTDMHDGGNVLTAGKEALQARPSLDSQPHSAEQELKWDPAQKSTTEPSIGALSRSSQALQNVPSAGTKLSTTGIPRIIPPKFPDLQSPSRTKNVGEDRNAGINIIKKTPGRFFSSFEDMAILEVTGASNQSQAPGCKGARELSDATEEKYSAISAGTKKGYETVGQPPESAATVQQRRQSTTSTGSQRSSKSFVLSDMNRAVLLPENTLPAPSSSSDTSPVNLTRVYGANATSGAASHFDRESTFVKDVRTRLFEEIDKKDGVRQEGQEPSLGHLHIRGEVVKTEPRRPVHISRVTSCISGSEQLSSEQPEIVQLQEIKRMRSEEIERESRKTPNLEPEELVSNSAQDTRAADAEQFKVPGVAVTTNTGNTGDEERRRRIRLLESMGIKSTEITQDDDIEEKRRKDHEALLSRHDAISSRDMSLITGSVADSEELQMSLVAQRWSPRQDKLSSTVPQILAITEKEAVDLVGREKGAQVKDILQVDESTGSRKEQVVQHGLAEDATERDIQSERPRVLQVQSDAHGGQICGAPIHQEEYRQTEPKNPAQVDEQSDSTARERLEVERPQSEFHTPYSGQGIVTKQSSEYLTAMETPLVLGSDADLHAGAVRSGTATDTMEFSQHSADQKAHKVHLSAESTEEGLTTVSEQDRLPAKCLSVPLSQPVTKRSYEDRRPERGAVELNAGSPQDRTLKELQVTYLDKPNQHHLLEVPRGSRSGQLSNEPPLMQRESPGTRIIHHRSSECGTRRLDPHVLTYLIEVSPIVGNIQEDQSDLVMAEEELLVSDIIEQITSPPMASSQMRGARGQIPPYRVPSALRSESLTQLRHNYATKVAKQILSKPLAGEFTAFFSSEEKRLTKEPPKYVWSSSRENVPLTKDFRTTEPLVGNDVFYATVEADSGPHMSKYIEALHTSISGGSSDTEKAKIIHASSDEDVGRNRTLKCFRRYEKPCGSRSLSSVTENKFRLRLATSEDIEMLLKLPWGDSTSTITAGAVWTRYEHTPFGFFVAKNDTQDKICGAASVLLFRNEVATCTIFMLMPEYTFADLGCTLWNQVLHISEGKDLTTVLPQADSIELMAQFPFHVSAVGTLMRGPVTISCKTFNATVTVIDYSEAFFKPLVMYDKIVFGFDRERFLDYTLKEEGLVVKVAVGENDIVKGFAAVQADRWNGPVLRWLMADDFAVAESLLHNFIRACSEDESLGIFVSFYTRSPITKAICSKLNTTLLTPWQLLYNRREPILNWQRIVCLTDL